MTTYYENDDGTVTDLAGTHGIVNQEYLDCFENDVQWVTAMSPHVLRRLADLIEFCYTGEGYVDVGLLESQGVDNEALALIVGNVEDDRKLMATPRTDGHVNQENKQDNTLENYE